MKNCIVCQSQAEVFCFQDEAYLCHACDEQVHSANVLARRHHRAKICELCTAAPSTVYCKNDQAYLCGACDVEAHQGVVNSRHERVAVTTSTTPQVDECDGCSQIQGTKVHKSVEDDDSFLAVPSVPVMGNASVDELPDWNSLAGPLDAKALMCKEFQEELEMFDMEEMDPMWMDRLDMGFDDLPDSLLEGLVPGVVGKDHNHLTQDISDNEISSSALCVPTVLYSLDCTEAPLDCTANTVMAHRSLQKQNSTHPVPQQHIEPLHMVPTYVAPPVVNDLYCSNSTIEVDSLDVSTYLPRSMLPIDELTMAERTADRRMRLERFRSKKKNRQFKKTIRYASRKAYAEVRPRIKGRFARKDEVVAMRASGLLPMLSA